MKTQNTKITFELFFQVWESWNQKQEATMTLESSQKTMEEERA